jgi:hypothetical protein
VAALTVALVAAVAARPSVAADGAGGLQHFGYFAARLTPSGGDHLAEVRDRSNLNWVQVSDYDRYRPEVLDGCSPRGCIVSTGNEFFTGCDKAGSTTCRLYPNYRERWMRLANAINSRFDKVGAFYLLDEPQWRGASPADVAKAAALIKHTHPSTPVMMIEAGPKVTDSLQVPPNIDWVGFDWYCRPFSDIRAKLSILERRTTASQRLFLMPEAAPLNECGAKPGHATDAEIARLQWSYFDLAVAHPRVIGLLAFGFWTSGHGSGDLPLTVAAHRQIAARILPSPSPPPLVVPPAAGAPPSRVAPLRPGIAQRRARLDRSGAISLRITCPRRSRSACTGRLSVTARLRGTRRRIGHRRFALAPGDTRRLRVAIRPRARRVLRRRSGIRLTVCARTAAGTTSRRIMLRA